SGPIRTGPRPEQSHAGIVRSFVRRAAQAGQAVDALAVLLLLVAPDPLWPLAVGPVQELAPGPDVLVEGDGVAARVGDPLHVQDDDRAGARVRRELAAQLIPLGVPRLDRPPPAVEAE